MRATGGRPRRVLHIVTRMNVGGPARHVLALTARLRVLGLETLIAFGTPDPGEGELAPDEDASVRIPALRRRLDPVSDYRARAEIDRAITRYRPDVVHTHMAKAGALGRGAARRRGVPAVLHTFHGHVLEGYFASPANKAFLLAERRLARRTDRLIAVSSATRDELLELGVGRTEQWRVVPLELDLESIFAARLSPSDARERLGLPDVPTVGIVGRLVPIKNHVLFLEAAALVARERPNVSFVVAGDGELRTLLDAEAAQRLGNRIRFVGWIEDLTALYAALDVVVLTSLNEGTPVALIEAAAAGRPVVATDVGGVADVVVEGETGFLAPSGDARAVAQEILALLGEPELAGRMGEAGRRRARKAFAGGLMAGRIVDLYEEILAAKSVSG
jgi:glycosyltransferase involved in cell wall biosynthesis